jgi:two-component system nitrate/nitrite sensor histidine kinase NarX
MFRTASLSTKLIRIGASLLVVALASISLTLWVTWQLEGGAAAVNEAGRMRMQTWRLAQRGAARRRPAEGCAGRAVRRAASGCCARATRRGRSSFPATITPPRRPLPWCERESGCADSRAGARGRHRGAGARRAAGADAFVSRIDTLRAAASSSSCRGLTAILNAVPVRDGGAGTIGSAVAMLYSAYLFI